MSSILTVITPAPTYDLTTLATAKDEIPSTTISDATYVRYIREASDVIASYLGRVLAQETVSESWRCVRSSQLVLARYPVASIDSVTVDGTALAPTEYEANLAVGQLWRLSSDGSRRIPWCDGNHITVQYTGGYALLDSMPYAIEAACLSLIKHKVAARGRDPSLRSRTIDGVGQEQYWVGSTGGTPGLPDEVATWLEPFLDVRM